MKSGLPIGVAFALIFLNIVIGHFLPLTVVTATVVLLPAITALVNFTNKDLQLLLKAVIIYILFAVNDIGLKLFVVGKHGWESLGFVTLFTLGGLLLSLIILTFSFATDKSALLKQKILAITIFMFLIVTHLFVFEKLGMQ